MPLELYVKINGEFIPVSNAALPSTFRPIVKTTLTAAFEKYDRTCISQKCLKNQGVERYLFSQLKTFLETQGALYVDEVMQQHLEEFRAVLAKRMKASSVNRRMNPIKNFFVKCHEWKLIHENPAKINKLKEEQNPFSPWPEEIFFKFIFLTEGVHTELFYFLYLTGCRPAEAKNLKWTDIDHDDGIITLRCGKNAQYTRYFPITDELSRLFHQMKPRSQYVFTFEGKQLDNQLLYHYCKDRMKQITDKKLTVYGIRHAFGTNLNAAGVNSLTIANLMGHQKLETTRRYTHHQKNILIQALGLI